jgi:hypothetical protein
MSRYTQENNKDNNPNKMSSKDINNAKFKHLLTQYLESNPILKTNNKTNEFEIRFGTNPKLSHPITKIDYDNVIKQLYACGFKTNNINGVQMLRIQNEFLDTKTGQKKISNIRAEIIGTDLIQEYCKTNSLQRLIDMPSNTYNKIKFTQKMDAVSKTGEILHKVSMDDYNFRVSYQTEQDYNIQTNISRNIINSWNDSLKLFRTMNRIRFYHNKYPIYADLSIVKSSKTINNVSIPKYTIQESGIFDNIEKYEIELELDNTGLGVGTEYNTVDKLMELIRKSIRIILSGLQETKYPISIPEQTIVLNSYMKLIHGENYELPKRILPKHFIGPNSQTLQLENLVDNATLNYPNIHKNYTVTDKADGQRKLLYINDKGKIYLIDTTMKVIFTGAKTNEKTIINSILDGEHIKYNKDGKFINLYAAFDVYFINNLSTRELPFQIDETLYEQPPETRLSKLSRLTEIINPKLCNGTNENTMPENDKCIDFQIKCKTFYYDTPTKSIFNGCSDILSNVKDGIFEYNTDGLIFTPSKLPVGGDMENGPAGPLSKFTWKNSFKWKPPEYNTIDFLVSVKKNTSGKDEIHHIFQDGNQLDGNNSLIQYKTLILRCGFDKKRDININPCMTLINGYNYENKDDNSDTYIPVPFHPTNPYDDKAHLCNVKLYDDGIKLYMKTEEDEYFEEDMIVEFKYIIDNECGWKWVPLRVRYDKTAELRAGIKNYGNSYQVANNNWHSIHNPITEEMISTGNNIPTTLTENNDVYYNKSNNKTNTRALRDFHNLYVKSKLIKSVSNKDDTLIDYAVGKAGDLFYY